MTIAEFEAALCAAADNFAAGLVALTRQAAADMKAAKEASAGLPQAEVDRVVRAAMKRIDEGTSALEDMDPFE